jgi:hypothetical protein
MKCLDCNNEVGKTYWDFCIGCWAKRFGVAIGLIILLLVLLLIFA